MTQLFKIPYGVTRTEGWMTMGIGRRRFIALLGGATVMGSIASRAQPSGRMRTIGFLMGLANDAESQARVRAFEQALEKEGWILGEDVQIKYRFAAGDANRMRALAKELVGLQPDLIVGHST